MKGNQKPRQKPDRQDRDLGNKPTNPANPANNSLAYTWREAIVKSCRKKNRSYAEKRKP